MSKDTVDVGARLDELRHRRAELRKMLAVAHATKKREHEATATSVASSGSVSVGWAARSNELATDVASLEQGMVVIDKEIHLALGACRLAVAKLEQKLFPVMRSLETCYRKRSAHLTAGVTIAQARAPMPAAFAATLAELEAELAVTNKQIDALNADIAAAAAPVNRYDKEMAEAAAAA